MAEVLPGTFVPLTPVIGLIVGIIVIVIAWKVFKFTAKKVSAVIAGLAGIAVIALSLSEGNLNIFTIIGLGLLFGAISNFFG